MTSTTFAPATMLAWSESYSFARRNSAMVREATSPFVASDDMRPFLSADGRSGFMIRADGELTNVFSLERGRGADLVTSAVANGATHLDCFDGYLPSLYARHGFERVTSLPNWTPGGPDVVYMATRGHFLAALDKAEASLA
jgi:hypothetical protein